MRPDSDSETFHWSECADFLRSLATKHDLQLEPRARFFEAEGIRVTPPAVFPLPLHLCEQDTSAQAMARRKAQRERSGEAGPSADLHEYINTLPQEPGLQCVILLQAGIASIGMFEGGHSLATRTLKRYVVRGKGRAQPGYLSSKGKSRYGSRLRLQNARLLLQETNEKLHEFWSDHGTPDEIFVGAPKRLFPELFLAKHEPPFSKEGTFHRIPLDIPKPTTAILLRTYTSLCYGRVMSVS